METTTEQQQIRQAIAAAEATKAQQQASLTGPDSWALTADGRYYSKRIIAEQNRLIRDLKAELRALR